MPDPHVCVVIRCAPCGGRIRWGCGVWGAHEGVEVCVGDVVGGVGWGHGINGEG